MTLKKKKVTTPSDMKVRAYFRVAKTSGNKFKLSASVKPDNTPLHTIGYRNAKNFLPTVAFALDLDIPDESFNRAATVLSEVVLRTQDTAFAVEIA